MQKIVPHLWFNTQAREAAEFYIRTFGAGRITDNVILPNTPSGDAEFLVFEIAGHEFMAISGGPAFTKNPSISFMVNFDPAQDASAASRIDTVWEALVEGGKVLMPLGEYPFSTRYGWLEDRFGTSWQLILTDAAGEVRPFIMPELLFTQEMAGKAQEATAFYRSLFPDSKEGMHVPYGPGMAPEAEDSTMFSDFTLAGQWFVAADSAQSHNFAFNEGVSLLIRCDSQEEVDRYWDALSAVPEAEQCGWLKDKYGVSWQVSPIEMEQMLSEGTPEQVARVIQAFLPMKKFDVQALRDAYNG